MELGPLVVYRSFNSRRVKYLLIGGLAAVLYGSPRLTKDIDLFIEPTLDNAKRALAALRAAHFGTANLTNSEKVLAHEVTIFEDYLRVDLLTRVKGLSFQEAWRHRVVKRIGAVRVPLVSLEDLIRSKKAAGRSVDVEDVKLLRRIQFEDRRFSKS